MGIFANDHNKLSAEEQEFRKENLHHSFMSSLYYAIGGAAFIGVLNNLAQIVLGAEGADITDAEGSVTGHEQAGFNDIAGELNEAIFSPKGVITAGMTGLGAFSVYKSNYEYTEAKALQDAHLARQTALAQQQAREDSVALVEQVKQEVGKEVKEVVEEVHSAKENCKPESDKLQAAPDEPETPDDKVMVASIAGLARRLQHTMGMGA